MSREAHVQFWERVEVQSLRATRPAMESFYGRYKTTAVRDHIFADEAELRANVFDYIEVFYNRFRKHAALDYLSPMQAEAKFLAPMGARQLTSCPYRN